MWADQNLVFFEFLIVSFFQLESRADQAQVQKALDIKGQSDSSARIIIDKKDDIEQQLQRLRRQHPIDEQP